MEGKLDRQIVVRFDQATWDKLVSWADRQDRPIAWLIRAAVSQYLSVR